MSANAQQMKQEIEAVGTIHDLLQLGTFPGHVSQKLLISQLYMRKLHDELRLKERADEEARAEDMAPTPKQIEEARSLAKQNANVAK